MKCLFWSLILATSVGCGSRVTIDEHPCPTGGTSFTYDNFGKGFLDRWCQECHAAKARERNGAPPSYAFGSRDDASAHRDRIFAKAAADNTSMPPGTAGPSPEERRMLADWLACGAP